MNRRLSALCILGLLIVIPFVLLAVPPSRATGSLSGIKICIDPGHGGTDPGAVNDQYGLWESEINLDVSFALKTLLEADGAVVVLTREGDFYRTNSDRYTFCNTEQATILVSVHTNSSTNSSMDGSLTLYFQSDDKALAQVLHEVMYPSLRDTAPDPASFTDFGLDRFASGVLLKSDMPAAMMEPLFMSNPAEAELLVQRIADGCQDLACRRGQIVQVLYQGVLNYFGGAEPPTPTPEPAGTMHVAAVDMSYGQKGPNIFVYTQVTIQDENGTPVSGVVVSVDTTQPDGTIRSDAGTTGEDGTVTLTLRTRQHGDYASEVTDVSKDGWVYDSAANVETGESLVVP